MVSMDDHRSSEQASSPPMWTPTMWAPTMWTPIMWAPTMWTPTFETATAHITTLDPYSGPTNAVTQNFDPYRKTFFDLAATLETAMADTTTSDPYSGPPTTVTRNVNPYRKTFFDVALTLEIAMADTTTVDPFPGPTEAVNRFTDPYRKASFSLASTFETAMADTTTLDLYSRPTDAATRLTVPYRKTFFDLASTLETAMADTTTLDPFSGPTEAVNRFTDPHRKPSFNLASTFETAMADTTTPTPDPYSGPTDAIIVSPGPYRKASFDLAATFETAMADTTTPTPDPYSGPTDAIIVSPTPHGKTFFDLAPEARVEVYRQLFKGHVIVIRGQDEIIVRRRREKLKRFERDHAMGLNILFVSKACLAEAKPVALSVATFDINFTSMLRNGTEKYLRKLQNFGRPELALVRTIDLPKIPHATEGLAYQLSAMPFLHDVVWNVPEEFVVRGRHQVQIESHPVLTRLANELRGGYLWDSPAHKIIKRHVQESALRVRKPARYLFKLRLRLWSLSKDFSSTLIAYADFLTETIHVVDAADEKKIVVPKRAEPSLFTALH
ncbi:hypothetical protein CLCR_04006 [Cladophialophora carrionii]|uniref:Uncharacterized protein n=1 Tax=Cladophialophora carrionii TaxID=86049 RepID=A0A1C1CJ94_9EURO|nr:hypothetical protein CLCR_04006 [Cladophialophora carrionii]